MKKNTKSTMLKKWVILSFSVVILFSCDKESEECNITVNSIAGSYKITSMLYKESATASEMEVQPIWFDACEIDDILTFNTNGTYQVTDAGIKCTPPGDDNGTWALNGNIMQVDGDPTTIKQFDCKKLILVNTDTQVAGDTFTITLSKQ